MGLREDIQDIVRECQSWQDLPKGTVGAKFVNKPELIERIIKFIEQKYNI